MSSVNITYCGISVCIMKGNVILPWICERSNWPKHFDKNFDFKMTLEFGTKKESNVNVHVFVICII